jgi:hypothetical protein
VRQHPDGDGPSPRALPLLDALRRRLGSTGGYLLGCFMDGLVASGSAWCPGGCSGGDWRSQRASARTPPELEVRREVSDGLRELEAYLAASAPRPDVPRPRPEARPDS